MYSKIKNIFYSTLIRSIWAITACGIAFIALIGLGSIAEDNATTAVMLAHFAGKTLILIFAFFAAKFPLLFLIKGITISGGTSAFFLREAISVKPSNLNDQPAVLTKKNHPVTNLHNIPNSFSTTRYIRQKLNSFEVY